MLFLNQIRSYKLTLFVAALHALVGLSLCLSTSTPLPIPKTTRPLAVHSVTFREESAPTLVINAPKEEEKKSTPTSTAPPLKSIEKKSVEKKSVEKTATVTPKKKAAESVPKKEEKSSKGVVNKAEVAALLQKSMQQSSKGSSKKSSQKEFQLKSEGVFAAMTFDEELVVYLQEQLSVPEPGAITVSISLSAAGAFLGMKVVKCGSEGNRVYLEKSLSTLVYPSFASYFPQESKRTFSLTLQVE